MLSFGLIAGPMLMGVAVAYLVWVLLTIATAPRLVDPVEGRFEEERREQLRVASWTYRTFEPWIDEMVQGLPHKPQVEDKLQRDLTSAGEVSEWQPAEYLAARRVEAILAAIVGGVVGNLLGGILLALPLGGMAFWGYQYIQRKQVASRAERRRVVIKRRFSAAIDLMSLMMEVGSSFAQALETVNSESEGHALGEELQRIVKDIELGRPRRSSLEDFANRVADEDVSEMVFAVVEGEELGTPMASILQSQAEQMRKKRSQWAEKAAEESQVALVFPAMIIMVACLITVAAPFVLNALFSFRGY